MASFADLKSQRRARTTANGAPPSSGIRGTTSDTPTTTVAILEADEGHSRSAEDGLAFSANESGLPRSAYMEMEIGQQGLTESSDNPTNARASTSVSTVHEDLYAVRQYRVNELPTASLDVRIDPRSGRGIYSKKRVSKGTTLLALQPHLSVLDQVNLPNRCSCCFREPQTRQGNAPFPTASGVAPNSSLGDRPNESLMRCSRCKVVNYCSVKCQTSAWPSHKPECTALIRWSKAARQYARGREDEEIAAGWKVRGGNARGNEADDVPDTPIRALGRLVWARLREEETWWKEIESMETHRSKLSETDKQKFGQLAVALAQYVGKDDLQAAGFGSAIEIMDLCSRFTSNSFSLTSPDLSNIGVSVCPMAALINHSCEPNAVVVFPEECKSGGGEKVMKVVAIKEIQQNEQVLTSYVDLALRRLERQQELSSRYHFVCGCFLCKRPLESKDWVDPRFSLRCPHLEECTGVWKVPEPGQVENLTCPTCRHEWTADGSELARLDLVATQAYKEADRLQFSNPNLALVKTSESILMLHRQFAPSSHPLLALMRLNQSLLLSSSPSSVSSSDPGENFSKALVMSPRIIRGMEPVYPSGHPALAIALATYAKLLLLFLPRSETSIGSYLSSINRAMVTLKRAIEQLDVGFGKERGGGKVGREMRNALEELELERTALVVRSVEVDGSQDR